MSGRISTNTGDAPVHGTTSAVEAKVKDGQNTASPGPISQAIRGRTMASVPLAQDRPCLAWPKAAICCSKALTGGPMMKAPDSITAIIDSVMRAPIR